MTEWSEFKEEEFKRDPLLKKEYNKMLPVRLAADIIRFRKRKGMKQAQLKVSQNISSIKQATG